MKTLRKANGFTIAAASLLVIMAGMLIVSCTGGFAPYAGAPAQPMLTTALNETTSLCCANRYCSELTFRLPTAQPAMVVLEGPNNSQPELKIYDPEGALVLSQASLNSGRIEGTFMPSAVRGVFYRMHITDRSENGGLYSVIVTQSE